VTGTPPGFVDVVRNFLAAYRAIRMLTALYRRGALRFERVQELFTDAEASPLFRLKEGCHALFRPRPGRSRVAMHREVLFDLAVGSLFHEAMKFRENFYQREVYGPRVWGLRGEAGADGEALFREFEKIEATVGERLEEGLQETETLLEQTRFQLRLLLAEHRTDGHLARCLREQCELVEEVFEMKLDQLLDEVYGGGGAGYDLAGRSYLASGYFDAAESAFSEAAARGGAGPRLAAALAYARGMKAYMAGDYGESIAELGRWAEKPEGTEEGLVSLAHTAVSSIGRLVRGPDRERVVAAATALLERMPLPRPSGGSGLGAEADQLRSERRA
jgi:hypothetical protein